MRGRPLLSCVACQSMVIVPELPAMVVRSASAGAAPSPRSPAVIATQSFMPGLLAAPTLVPRSDGHTIGWSGRADRLLEVDLVIAPDRAGNEAHALRRHLALGIEGLHEEAGAGVPGLGAHGDHVAHDEAPPRFVLRHLPVEGDGARIAHLRAGLGSRRRGPPRARHAG